MSLRQSISIALIIILGFLVYCNSLGNEFIWDDSKLVKNNEYIKNWSNIKNIFTTSVGEGAGRESRLYRPFQIFTYKVDYSLWGLNAAGYRLTNILLHILVALSLYWFINILYDDKILSLFTSMLFVAHPIHTEAVTYISGRTDPLSALFILLCLICYIKLCNANSPALYVLTLLSYSFALLSRENSLILPLVLLLYHYTFRKKLKLKYFLSMLTVAFVYVLLRMTVLGSLLAYTPVTTLAERIPGVFVAIANYARLMLLPFHLHMEYGGSAFNFADPRTIFGLLILTFSLIYAFKKRHSNRLVFFSVCWFFVMLFPVSNIYPVNAYMAEHWLYLPSIGFFIILANGLSGIYRRKDSRVFSVILIISLLGFYSSLTILQNTYWKEPIAFFERTLRYAPNSARVHYSLGNRYNNIGRKEEAIKLYKKAIAIRPDHAEAHNNLGTAYSDTGRPKKAIFSFKKAIEIDPNHPRAHNNLGVVYSDTGKREEAVILYKKAIEIKPDFAEAYNNLGVAYYRLGRGRDAVSSYKKAIEINPGSIEAYNSLGVAYYKLGRKEEAVASLNKAMKLEPGRVEAYNNLGVIYYQEGQYELAVEYFNKAKKLGFTNPLLLKALDHKDSP